VFFASSVAFKEHCEISCDTSQLLIALYSRKRAIVWRHLHLMYLSKHSVLMTESIMTESILCFPLVLALSPLCSLVCRWAQNEFSRIRSLFLCVLVIASLVIELMHHISC
jgi:hypothetical protein